MWTDADIPQNTVVDPGISYEYCHETFYEQDHLIYGTFGGKRQFWEDCLLEIFYSTYFAK